MAGFMAIHQMRLDGPMPPRICGASSREPRSCCHQHKEVSLDDRSGPRCRECCLRTTERTARDQISAPSRYSAYLMPGMMDRTTPTLSPAAFRAVTTGHDGSRVKTAAPGVAGVTSPSGAMKSVTGSD